MEEIGTNYPAILDSIPDVNEYTSITDRYFTRHYCLSVNGKSNDFMLLYHSNRVTLLALAPTHPFFKKQGKFKINYIVGKLDRTKNSVKGKGKKGGQILGLNSIVCTLEMEDGTSYSIPSCTNGVLVEVNERLLQFPELLRDLPSTDGYIAIILSKIDVAKSRKSELVTHENYIKLHADN